MRTPRDKSRFRRVKLRPESKTCCACGEALVFDWNNQRFVSFVGEALHIDYHVYTCVNPDCELAGRPRKPEVMTSRVLPNKEFGLDVVALIGYCRLQMSLSFPKITRALAEVHKVEISEREVEDMFNLYVALATTDLRTDEGLRARLRKQGRMVLTIDAAKPERDGEALWLMRDHISEEVLMGFVARNIDAEALARKIREVASLGIPIEGVVSDGEPVIVDAVGLALPGKPHQLCQYHFLSNFAKEVTALDSKVQKQLKADLKGLNRFEDAAEEKPSNRPTETEIAGPQSLAVNETRVSKKRGAGASTKGSAGRGTRTRRGSSATCARS